MWPCQGWVSKNDPDVIAARASPHGGEHGGRLLDHLEVDVKHNGTSHFTELLEPVDLTALW
jgi:hypothetical protein